ncbi:MULTISPECIES: aminotransferase class V-fold PLP-dependent enzyme [Spirosoma]|uniref:phosphoserine transaminase n=1 Tax=Spirosoma sordidisoli TaxID=2502893 RepID=A0A4Q2UHT9_9BACT|nr:MULTISPECIES: aminotransferase class V-fold PLP-dependent enzyme [Spirosoma]RYC68754.1 aminotransferase class V-fold PLP-dependent enzyme [Spirosoma sordidisoli]
MKNTYFTPGPAELYPSFYTHLQTALDEQIGSISHRSRRFQDIYRHTDEQLRLLLNIPATHRIFFTGSASEVWERILLNCVEHESFHAVNGSFSRKFYDYAQSLHKFAHLFEKPFGQGFDAADIDVPEYAEVVCLTHNETSSGVQMKPADMHKLKRKYPKKLFCVDMVSSAPYPDLDFGLIDSAFFSVQKAFGMPAGLGVWIASEACLEKAERLQQYDSLTIGAHHTLPTLWKNAQTFETPATPNVLFIYILGKLAEDFNQIGIANIRRQTEEKAKAIYKFLEGSEAFEPFVKEERHRSQTVIVANTRRSSADVIASARMANMVVGSGYGKLKDSQIRIANFPATSAEQVEQLLRQLAR